MGIHYRNLTMPASTALFILILTPGLVFATLHGTYDCDKKGIMVNLKYTNEPDKTISIHLKTRTPLIVSSISGFPTTLPLMQTGVNMIMTAYPATDERPSPAPPEWYRYTKNELYEGLGSADIEWDIICEGTDILFGDKYAHTIMRIQNGTHPFEPNTWCEECEDES